MKSKQLPLLKNEFFKKILSVNSIYKFSEMYLSYSLTVTTNK